MLSQGTKQILPNYDAYEPIQQPAWHNNPKGAVVAFLTLVVTNSSPVFCLLLET